MVVFFRTELFADGETALGSLVYSVISVHPVSVTVIKRYFSNFLKINM